MTTKKQSPCDHDFHYSYDCFEDARILSGNMLGIPVKCSKCKIEGIEWFIYSNVSAPDDYNKILQS